MIFNVGGNEAVTLTAENVKYNDSNVADELTELEARASVLEDELTANGNRIYLDYQNGKYGYNTDALRGADTFSPFKSGGSSESEFTNLTTVPSITGDKLGTIYGHGYITLRRILSGNKNVEQLNIFIDGNETPFRISSTFNNGIQTNFFTFFFQESISFGNGNVADTYFYQTLLADEYADKKYNVVQGVTTAHDYTTITGKGKVLLSPTSNMILYYSVDGSNESRFDFTYHYYMEIMFNESITFKAEGTSSSFYFNYIAYTEL